MLIKHPKAIATKPPQLFDEFRLSSHRKPDPEKGAFSDQTKTKRAERVAIGRRNWLFAGNDAFGQHHAVLRSLIASAEAQGTDPQAPLRSVLAKIGATPLSELEQLLPPRWKADLAATPA